MMCDEIKIYQMSLSFIPVFLVLSLSLLYFFSISGTEIDRVFAVSNNSSDKKEQEKLIEQNATLGFGKYNFIAVGDYYCNKETEKTIKQILAINPEIIITTGDHVKNAKSADCWKKISKPIKDKMRIAIGNHDAEYSRIYKEITEYHNLKSPYYSHDFNNIHFISLSTEHQYEEGSKQYSFIKNDLEDASKNKNIDWIIVHNHKPLYSTN